MDSDPNLPSHRGTLAGLSHASEYAAIPSGLGPQRVAAAGAPARTSPAEDLHVCPDCASSFVYPLEWAPVDMFRWRVELRCPECEWTEAGIYGQDALDRFDQILDAATDRLVDDLHHLHRANMEDEVEALGLALDSGLILPEDF